MLHQVMHLRMRDFVLERDQAGEEFMREHFPISEPFPSGNGLPFIDFIADELVPLIETTYRAHPSDRTLLGHSNGANFALTPCFTAPPVSALRGCKFRPRAGG